MIDGQTNGTGTVMPVTPMYGGGGFGGFGDNGWWIILLFVLMGGWGNGFGNQGGGMYPWLNQSNQISDGFANQANAAALNGIQGTLAGGFAGVNASVTGAQNAIAQQLYTNQIAELERSFAAQTASTAGMSGIQSQLAQCCCDNRLATCQTQNIVQSESAATRSSIQGGIQAILDKMCQQELDAYKRENDNLRSMVNMQNLAASQAAQTAQLIADNTAQTQYIVNRVAPYPIPAYTVANPVTPAATTGA